MIPGGIAHRRHDQAEVDDAGPAGPVGVSHGLGLAVLEQIGRDEQLGRREHRHPGDQRKTADLMHGLHQNLTNRPTEGAGDEQQDGQVSGVEAGLAGN